MKRTYIIIITSLILIIVTLIGTQFFLSNSISKNINEIFKTESYSYLPQEAQDYIEQVYSETGEILLTEKNKQKNEYYLNPEYVAYLADENKDAYELIPDELITDYVYSNIETATLPTNFDLRNVNGNNYLTPIKNQGAFGLCWSFASIELAESYDLIKNNKSYTSGATPLLNARHNDYITATGALIDTNSAYRSGRSLTSGGNFTDIIKPAMDGYSFVNDSWIPYLSQETKLEYNKVINHSNSYYELNGTVHMPVANLKTVEPAYRTEYINRLKQLIMENGGAYVSSKSPTGECSIRNGNYRLIYDDGFCPGSGHAMQIIGWDDSYSYSVCTKLKDSNDNYYVSNQTSNCKGELVTGRGAWLVRNSWGNSYPYIYIAYDSFNTGYKVITDLSTRTWDVEYRRDYTATYATSNSVQRTFRRKFVLQETLDKIKVELLTQNETYDFYVSVTGETQNFIKVGSIYSDLPGIYTLDVSDKNIKLIGDSFTVKVSSNNGRVKSEYFNVYTKVAGIEIHTYDASFTNNLSSTDSYRIRLESDVAGISDGELINYRILDENGNEISSPYYYEENYVAGNKIFPILLIDKSLDVGHYTLQTIYDGWVYATSVINIKEKLVDFEGSGTINDPYLVETPEQLDVIRKSSTAYFKLVNDIDLTYDTQNPEGKFYNDGKGWEPLFYGSVRVSTNGYLIPFDDSFSGGLDGDGHKIIGLYINRPNEDVVGLFSSIYNNKLTNTYVKNLVIEDAFIIGHNYVGALAGLVSEYSYMSCLNVEKVSVLGGRVEGYNNVGGVIGFLEGGSAEVGACVNGNSERFKVYSLYNSSKVIGNNIVGGIIGYLASYKSFRVPVPVYLHELQNSGNVRSENNGSGLIGAISNNNDSTFTIENSITTGKVNAVKDYGIISDYTYSSSSNYVNVSNVYYTNNYDAPSGITHQYYNAEKKTISQLTALQKWGTFDSYWVKENYSGYNRIPILKSVKDHFTYMVLDAGFVNISLDNNQSVYLMDYIQPDLVTVDHLDLLMTGNAASIDDRGYITGNEKGQSNLRVTSLYDGLRKNIIVNVTKEPTVIFHSNYNNDVFVQTIQGGVGVLMANSFGRTGYNFIKWNTQPDGGGTDYANKASIEIENDLHLYAVWRIKNYNLSFVTNCEQTIDPIIVPHGYVLNTSDFALSKNGYNFDAWYTNEYLTNLYDVAEPITGDLTLYAGWVPKQYLVAFNANGGSIGPVIVPYTYNNPTNQLPTPVWLGHSFLGWYKEKECINQITDPNDTYLLSGDKTLYAKWEATEFDVIYNENTDDVVTNMPSKQTKYKNINLQLSDKIPTRRGYVFIKWNTQANGRGVNYEKGSIYTDNSPITLYAQWENLIRTLTFNPMGGTIGTTTMDVVMLEPFGTLPTPTRSGYQFAGWYYDDSYSGNAIKSTDICSLTGNSTLYARWEKLTIDIEKISEYHFDGEYIQLNDNTKVEDIILDEGYSITHVKLDESTGPYIVTGDSIIITSSEDNTVKQEYKVIIMGDVVPDGKITILDYVRTFQHVKKNYYEQYFPNITLDKFYTLLTGDYFRAGDMDHDGDIDIMDSVRLFNIIKDKYMNNN